MSDDTRRGGGIVRPARRPEGWRAPGPPPAGPGARPELWPAPGEDLCYLTGDWRIFQRLDGHRWSLDDLVTAWYAITRCAGRPPARAVDLGCGIGSVLMMVAWAFPETPVIGVEAQALSAGLARRSLAYNGASGRCEVRLGDLRDPATVPEGAVFDLVTGTPPYLPVGHGTVSDKVQCAPCRFELRGGVEAYCQAGRRLLAPGGRLVLCENTPQDDRVWRAAADAGLRVVSQRDVIPREGKPPLFSVFALAALEDAPPGPEGAPGPRVHEPALTVRDRAGARTADFQALRVAMGMPP